MGSKGYLRNTSLCGLLFTVLYSQSAYAQSLSSSGVGLFKTSAGATASFNNTISTTSQLSLTNSASNSFSDASAGGTARAQTDYGVNKAFARSTVNAGTSLQDVPNATAEASSTATSTWTDSITINKDGLTGTTANITYSFSVHGTITDDLGSNHQAKRTFQVFQDNNLVGKLDSSLNAGELTETLTTTPFAITYGTPFSLKVSLEAYAYRFENVITTSKFSRADYSNTATFTGMAVSDNLGTPVSGATYTAGSGTRTYVLAGGFAAVPEPATFVLLGLGLLGGIVLRRRK